MSLQTATRRFSRLESDVTQSRTRYILNIEKAKEKARKLETKGQLDKAIRQYERVLEELEGRPEFSEELALYNKLGDLYVKLGNVTAAVDEYEKAINHYADQGFPNNAIALCNKVLRNAPGRTHIYLKLANLMMQRGFASEAKQNLLEYAERMQKAGKLEEAFHALKEFADLSPDKEEIRLLLADQLKKAARTDEAHEQLAKLHQELQTSGDSNRTRATLERMRSIDPEYDLDAATPVAPAKGKKEKSSDIVFLDLDEDIRRGSAAEYAEEAEEAGEEVSQVEGLDVGESYEAAADVPVESLEIESTALDDSLEVPEIEQVDELPYLEVPEAGEDEEVEIIGLDEEELEEPVPTGVEGGDDLSALEVPSIEDGESLEVPWDVGEDEEIPGVPEAGTPVFAEDSDGAAEPAVGSGYEDTEIDADIEMPDVDIPEIEGPDEEEADSGEEIEVPHLAGLPMVDAGDVADEVDEVDEVDEIDLDIEDDRVSEIELEPPEIPGVTAPDLSALEAAVADDPDAPGPHRELGEALIEAGDRDLGVQELEIAFEAYQAVEDTRHAMDLLEELLRLDPNNVHYHQRRVEYALHEGDNGPLVDAYLALADALLRNEELDRARFVYERVLERDPGNESASIALETIVPEEVAFEQEPAEDYEPEFFEVPSQEAVEPQIPETAEPEPEGLLEPEEAAQEAAGEPSLAEPAAAPAAGSDFVDLGALIMDDEVVKDTRMRIERDESIEDEDKNFAEMLSEFKKGIDANIAADDAQAHYDLGVAFKEMGLLDEAISEFQKALRGSQDRLRTSESLGLCFFEKGQFAVAATVLRRAIESEPGGDDDKVGLLYWLGRCEEQQGRNEQALGHYQRIFSIDINFQDVSDRVNSLTQANG